MKKKVLILFDLEGCIGIDNLQNLHADYYLYCKECDLVLSTLTELYPDWDFSVCDCHGSGTILISLSYVFPNVHFFCMPWNIDFSVNYDYGMLFGFHGHSQTRDPMAHSFRPEIASVYIKNNVIGELGIFLNLFAYYNIPCIFINGSSYIENEIAEIKCLKSYNKHLGTYKNRDLLISAYQNLVNDLNKLTFLNFLTLNKYNDSVIKVNFIDINYVRYLSDYTSLSNYTIQFENTIDFFVNLNRLCTKIMNYQNERTILIQEIYDFVSHKKIIEPPLSYNRLRFLLNKPVDILSLYELTEIYDLLKKYYINFIEH